MNQSPDPRLLDALAGLDAEANMRVVQRTRRSVMEAAEKMREARQRGRYQFGLVLLALGALLMFLTPALWVIAEDIFNGERWLDAQTFSALFVVTMGSAIFAAVLVQLRNQNSQSEGL